MIGLILLTLMNILLLAYIAWKDWMHSAELRQLHLLLKAKDVPEFIQATGPAPETPEAEPAADLVYPEDAEPQDVIDAVRNHQSS